MNNYKYQFPDYDDTPLMSDWSGASTWTDSSYKNDVCPSFTSENLMQGYIVKIFSEYDNEDLRENPDDPRFYVGLYDMDDTLIETLLYTDNMFDVEALIKRLEHAETLKA